MNAHTTHSKQCLGIKRNGERCNHSLAAYNQSGYCPDHWGQSKRGRKRTRANQNRRRSKPEVKAQRAAASRLQRENRIANDTCASCGKNPICHERSVSNCSSCLDAQLIRSRSKAGRAHANLHHNAADINICLSESRQAPDGRPLCTYSLRVCNESGPRGTGKAVGEHIDSEIKGTKEDGPRNWVLAESSINSSKSKRNLFAWWVAMHKEINLRPLADILCDLDRLGKRIPPVPDECRERVIEEIARSSITSEDP